MLVIVVSGKSREDSVKTLRFLLEKYFNWEKKSFRSISGKSNGWIKLVTFQNAIDSELVMVLPSMVGKETLTQFASTMQC
jgi:hypothetical protein